MFCEIATRYTGTQKDRIQQMTSDEKPKPAADRSSAKPTPEADAGKKTSKPDAETEIGGREGPDPTRYGDWEINGRCVDF